MMCLARRMRSIVPSAPSAAALLCMRSRLHQYRNAPPRRSYLWEMLGSVSSMVGPWALAGTCTLIPCGAPPVPAVSAASHWTLTAVKAWSSRCLCIRGPAPIGHPGVGTIKRGSTSRGGARVLYRPVSNEYGMTPPAGSVREGRVSDGGCTHKQLQFCFAPRRLTVCPPGTTTRTRGSGNTGLQHPNLDGV